MEKVLLIGLDGAGKTSLYQQFFLKKPASQLKQIPSTRGIAQYEHDFLRSDFLIIDTGGGKNYRQGYIGNAELVKDISAIVFVVDVQDISKFQEASNFFTVWLKSIATHLKGVRGYLIFNKIDPGMEGQLKGRLEQIAKLLAPLENLFPGELFKTISSIYTDSASQIFQRILLELMPRKMSERKVQPITTQQPIAKPPISDESYVTTPVKIDESPSKLPPRTLKVPPRQTDVSPPTTTVKPPAVTVPKIESSDTPTSHLQKTISPPNISKSPAMVQAEVDKTRGLIAERLSDIIEATLDNNPNFVAIAVYSEQVECVVGAVQQGKDPEILKTIEVTLKKINIGAYMDRLGKVRIGGEGHIKIEQFDIFFEKVSPEHFSTVICSSLHDDTVNNIAQLNRYLNQALSITPEGAEEGSFKRADLMAELKMRLQTRGKSIDEML
ncbi:MAG: hypothetical protein FK731_10690 [Asgard group archaeon]|nr:hypothetical protein [Asgard group archaeon]